MDKLAEALVELGATEGYIVSKTVFDAMVAALTDEQKQAVKQTIGGDVMVKPVVVDEPVEDLYMSWSIYESMKGDIDNWKEDLSTDAPDGVYTVRFDYLNGRFGEEHGVIVHKGRFVNRDEILTLVAKARNTAGYWGTFLEELEYDAASNKFNAVIGS